VRLRDIVERHNAIAELEEKVCAEGHDGPERQLQGVNTVLAGGRDTYVWDNLVLDLGRQRNVAEEERNVDLEKEVSGSLSKASAVPRAGPPAAKGLEWHASFCQTVQGFDIQRETKVVDDGVRSHEFVWTFGQTSTW
jgi:hypothetical protein